MTYALAHHVRRPVDRGGILKNQTGKVNRKTDWRYAKSNTDPHPEQTKVRVAGLAGYYAANAECVSRKLQIEPWDVWHLPCEIVDRTLDGKCLFKWMKKKIVSVQNSILVRRGYQPPKRGPRVGLKRK